MLKKFFSRALSYGLLLDIACIFVFFAPFVMCKGSITSTDIQYVTGFQAIFGGSHFNGMSIPVLCMFIFVCGAVVLDLLAYKFKALSFLNFILEAGTAVLMFCIIPLITAGLEISPSSWVISVHAGSMVDGSLLCLSALFSLANGFSIFKRSPEVKAE
jgi:hypothetical protein